MEFYLGSLRPCYTAAMKDDCAGQLHPSAIKGLALFNQGKFFEAHEELEEAWREEKSAIRDLYRGILQIAVVYLHVRRGNYAGAIKVYGRSSKWIRKWPAVCRGIQVQKMMDDLEAVMREVGRLGSEKLSEINPSLFKNIEWALGKDWICDRCGNEMVEHNCKITCPNCGNRFDCSDLNIYFD